MRWLRQQLVLLPCQSDSSNVDHVSGGQRAICFVSGAFWRFTVAAWPTAITEDWKEVEQEGKRELKEVKRGDVQCSGRQDVQLASGYVAV